MVLVGETSEHIAVYIIVRYVVYDVRFHLSQGLERLDHNASHFTQCSHFGSVLFTDWLKDQDMFKHGQRLKAEQRE